MKLFLDESGNSGMDIYNVNQPVLAYGGVWLDAANQQHFRGSLTTSDDGITSKAMASLKGRTLLKTDAGCAAVADIFHELNARKVPVSMLGIHKQFMAAGVIVDDCTDYVYNSEFTERWTWDTDLIEPLTQAILDAADPEQLVQAWRARSGDDKEALKLAYESLLVSLSRKPDIKLAFLATAMRRTDLDELWACCETGREERGGGYSPNVSAFGSIVQECEAQAVKAGLFDVAMVHDEQSQYSDAFSRWWSACRAARPYEFRYPSGNTVKLPLERLTSLEFAKSTAEIGIQLADVVASAMRVALHEGTIHDGVRSNDFIASMRTLIASRALMGGFPFVIGPPRWQMEMMEFLGMVDLLKRGILG